MNHLKFLFLMLLTPVLIHGFTICRSTPVRWVLNKDCSLKVNGSTNVNKFSCVIPNYPNADTLAFYRTNLNEPIKITGVMILDVRAFDCHNPIMTKDLRKTLKAEKFPNLIIKFISLSKYPDPSEKDNSLKGAVTISIAGVTKKFDIAYKCLPINGNTITLIGSKQVTFSDFNILPPRKLGGMIQTNDALAVEFILKMTQLN